MDWAQIQQNALTGKRLTALSDLSAVLILSLSGAYRPRYKWTVSGEKPNDTDWNDIEHAISQMEDEIMKGLIGAIIPHVLADIGDFEALDCDGSSYLREDYPELYSVIDPALIIDADTFRVPNLSGKFPIGKSEDYDIGDTGGEAEVTLTIPQLPSHTHGNVPHEHGYIYPASVFINGGLEAPASAAQPFPEVTNSTTIEIDETGGDNPHNNMPPYFVVSWLIVAR